MRQFLPWWRGGTPTKDEFARRVQRSLAAAVPEEAFTYDAEAFALRGAGSVQINLHNFYREYCDLPAGRRDAVAQRVAVEYREATRQPTADEARSRLFLRLQSRGWAQTAGTVHRVVADRLAACLCLDFPTIVSFVNAAGLERWGLDEDTAYRIAQANLARHAAGRFVEESPGLFRSPWQDTHDASRALLPWVLEGVPLAGDHAERVVAVPNRDTLLVTRADDLAALKRMIERTEAGFETGRSLALRLYVAGGETLAPLRLPVDHTLYHQVERLDRLDLLEEYQVTEAPVAQRYRERGEEVYFASVMILQDQASEATRTASAWSQGVDTVLPQTDLVALVPESQLTPDTRMLGMWPFDRLLAVAGTLMERVGEYPPRYRVRSFPSGEQIAALGEPAKP